MNSTQPGARRLAISILTTWTEKKERISTELNRRLTEKSLTDRDRRFITDLVNGVIRMQGRLDYELEKIYKGNYRKLKPELKMLLRSAAYQISFQDRVPDYAAVSTAVDLAKKINPSAGKMVNGVLRNYLRSSNDPPEKTSLKEFSAWLSHPLWLMDKWRQQWSLETAIALADWNNSIPGIYVRVNELRLTLSDFEAYCQSNHLAFEQFPELGCYYRVKEISRLLVSPLFKDGGLSVQDPAAGLVVRLLEPQKDDTITDGCSAPGGKAAYMAECLGNTGSIVAFDNDPERLSRVAETAERLKLGNLKTELKDISKQGFPPADKLLLDVPCSGTGVMAKRSDLRWRRNSRQIEELAHLQLRILQNAAEYVNPGGIIVYSTCTLEPEENWQIIEKFLSENKTYKIEPAQLFIPEKFCDEKGALFTFPPRHKIDGGFAVRLRKNDNQNH
ncbi:MAG: 16S rRNA (cytosine(967)-C(5))-methyltransferase RsmB [FCB group bacterium]|nr:16S rRNA (cytosine(967)-C(5))-methyltransferase RsmB [FCB group bacterium]